MRMVKKKKKLRRFWSKLKSSSDAGIFEGH